MSKSGSARFGIVVHGGAGDIFRKNLSADAISEYESVLGDSLEAGFSILKKGGASLDATEAAVCVLEDSPLFNAGKGSVFTRNGKNEMDASIMDGETLRAGAIAGVTTIRNPIRAAKKVMENSNHVLLIGAGAEQFAEEQALNIVDPEYFFDQKKWEEHTKLLRKKSGRDKSDTVLENAGNGKFGTVGAVCRDKKGNLAAGTSTGGITNKLSGRVGDSPIIGAGTYANNRTCAVSATGHGEYFIRTIVSYDISALMEYKGYSLKQAANFVVNKKLSAIKGRGGVIAMDKYGNIAMPFNTPGMFRGCLCSDGTKEILIFG